MTRPEPLLLLPGLLCDSDIWSAQRAAFADERQVIIPDYGRADSLAGMAAAVLAQAPARFALAGHSMGARIALEIIDEAPDRVARLALLDTGTHPPRPGERESREALLALGRRDGMAALVDRWLPPMVDPRRINDSALMTPLKAMANRPGVDGYERQITALLGRRDAGPLIPQIECPTLVCVGTNDAWSPPAQHYAIAAGIPGATLVIVPDSGHMAPAEAPDAVNAAIAAWLRQNA